MRTWQLVGLKGLGLVLDDEACQVLIGRARRSRIELRLRPSLDDAAVFAQHVELCQVLHENVHY